MKDVTNLEDIIIGRVDPHIYAFTTNTIPNYLKVGDTYRPVKQRLEEWKLYFPDLSKQFEEVAKVSDDLFFRDFSVHKYLERDLGLKRLLPEVLCALAPEAHYSKEFFKGAKKEDVEAAIADIKRSYSDNENTYTFYKATDRLPETHEYRSTGTWSVRKNQQDTIDRFIKAYENGRTNLLMYAVMRFGKSFTALCCAKAIEAKVVLVVSAKADVKEEWKKNVQSADNFKEYTFLDADALRNENIIKNLLDEDKRVVVFLTLQDLQGDDIKAKHKEIFENQIDLLIVDETHYGARAEKLGDILRKKDVDLYKDEDYIETEEAEKQIKVLNAKVKLHLSGTPYRILMGSEFAPEDIVAFYQYTDIVKDQKKWDKKNVSLDEPEPEWNNPYFGFPQMVRFAFHPSDAAKRKLEEFNKAGGSYAFSALFEPKSTKKEIDGSHKIFQHEQEILELFKAIDGSQKDENVLGFLDNHLIKDGKMCRHIVCVLPYCASCDALEHMLKKHKQEFENLSSYEIVNISGLDSKQNYPNVASVKHKIHQCEQANKKTITLTVNRMLTGSTVEEWDTMIFLKDTASPQEYDQAIFRLQSQYIKKYTDSDGHEIKFNMKPQTLLVDFDPWRMFRLQEMKALIYNENTDVNGNIVLRDRLQEELSISPIITLNLNQLKEVEPVDIIQAVSEYSSHRGVLEEAGDIPVDVTLFKNPTILETIQSQNELGSKKGLETEAVEGQETDMEIPDGGKDDSSAPQQENEEQTKTDEKDETKSLEKKFRTYYARVLFFAFLTKNRIMSLDEILVCSSESENARILKNLGIDTTVLKIIRENINTLALRQWEHKIYDINKLANDDAVDEIQRAETAIIKFGRFSESEITTPLNICRSMIEIVPDDAFLKLSQPGYAMLDIASKSGEFAITICERCAKLGIDKECIKGAILSIPTSSIAYEFTRKIYDILGLDKKSIASNFNSYDLLKVKRKDRNGTETKTVDYEKIAKILSQNKPLTNIKLNDNMEIIGEDSMKFSAIVGNPPYQEYKDNTSDSPIYHLFMDIAFQASDKVLFITPARFLFNAGKTPKEWNKKMLSDKHLKVVLYERESKNIFPGTNINGGIAITYRDSKKNYGAINYFCSDKKIKTILDKVLNAAGFSSLKRLVYLQNKFELDNLYTDFPSYKNKISSNGNEKRIVSSAFDNLIEVFTDKKKLNDDVQICGLSNRKRTCKYLKRKYLYKNSNIDTFKVLLSAADGASGIIGKPIPARIIGTPKVVEPGIGYTQTFISIGAFKTRQESINLYKYLLTKFARFMVGTIKTTNGLKIEVWSNVPVQNFSDNSDIDWTQTVAKIDQQLYEKYNLTEEEIDFIESMIKPME